MRFGTTLGTTILNAVAIILANAIGNDC